MSEVYVVTERCIGCGACVAIDPEHFQFDENGQSNCISDENLESENLVNAMESCPTAAIEAVVDNCKNYDFDAEECSCCEDGDYEDCDCEECDCEDCDGCDCDYEDEEDA